MDIPSGTLDKFHLGVSAERHNLLLQDVVERGPAERHRCVADFSDSTPSSRASTGPQPRWRAAVTRGREEARLAARSTSPSPSSSSAQPMRTSSALVGCGQDRRHPHVPEVACQLTKAMR